MKKHFILLLVALSVALSSFSQKLTVESETESKVEEDVYTIVEEMPEFPGGMKGMFEYLAKNIQYPPEAKANGIQGTVYVNFTIGKDGVVRDVKVVRGVNSLLDIEAVRVVSLMPKWKAGTQKGINVAVSYNLPISFKLGIDNLPPAKFFDEAITAHEKGDYEKAIELYTKAIKKDAGLVNAFHNRGLCYNKVGKLDLACEDWQKAKNMGSSDSKTLIKKYCKD